METPWSDEADRLFETEGHYADFVAWERWVSMPHHGSYLHDGWLEAWGGLDIYQRIVLYALFNLAIEYTGIARPQSVEGRA